MVIVLFVRNVHAGAHKTLLGNRDSACLATNAAQIRAVYKELEYCESLLSNLTVQLTFLIVGL